jgi:hypothetical protein
MNNIETIAKSATSSQAVSHDPSETVVSLFDCFALYSGILVLIACLTVCFAVAKAHAQDLPTQGSAQAATATIGWSSLESSASATSPRFLLSVAGLPDFQAFDSLKASTALAGGNPPADPANNYVANLTEDESLPSVSVLSLLQTRYVEWESSLADTRTLTSVNGTMVYPLFQINYSNGSLPVALYNSAQQ